MSDKDAKAQEREANRWLFDQLINWRGMCREADRDRGLPRKRIELALQRLAKRPAPSGAPSGALVHEPDCPAVASADMNHCLCQLPYPMEQPV